MAVDHDIDPDEQCSGVEQRSSCEKLFNTDSITNEQVHTAGAQLARMFPECKSAINDALQCNQHSSQVQLAVNQAMEFLNNNHQPHTLATTTTSSKPRRTAHAISEPVAARHTPDHCHDANARLNFCILRSFCPSDATLLRQCLGTLPPLNATHIPRRCLSQWQALVRCMTAHTEPPTAT
jgi:hypothetical protein